MTQVYSPNAAMVEGVNKALAAPETAPESENFAIKGGRVFARSAANTALVTTALVETVVLAILTVATSPLWVTNLTKPAFDWAKAHTVEAFGATKNAAAGIIGKATVTIVKPEESGAPKGKMSQASEMAANLYNKAMNTGSAVWAKTEPKHVVGVALAVAGYYFNIYGMAYNAGASFVGGAYNLGATGVGKVADRASYVHEGARNWIPLYGKGADAVSSLKDWATSHSSQLSALLVMLVASKVVKS